MALHLTLHAGSRQTTLQLPDDAGSPPAIDVIMALADPAHELVERGWLTAAEMPAMTAIQQVLFDRDREGFYIRPGVDLRGPAGSLDPDAPLPVPTAGTDGSPALTVTVVTDGESGTEAAGGDDQDETMARFQTQFVLFRLAGGTLIDVTKDDPFLTEPLRRLERERWITIDVDKAAWALTPAGQAEVDRLRQQARQLITRFDIFADVDDTGSTPRFGTGAGADWRIPIYELADVDPFEARFVLGLNDGEWTHLADWPAKTASAAWYDEIFAPVTGAPDVATLGKARLQRVLRAGSDIVHATLEEERQAGIDPDADRLPNPYRDGTL